MNETKTNDSAARAAGQKHSRSVITWTTPDGQNMDICTACQARLEAGRKWPKSKNSGAEYCRVHMGAHAGICDLAPSDYREVTPWIL